VNVWNMCAKNPKSDAIHIAPIHAPINTPI